MSFLITCPNCGIRDVEEFRFGGEYRLRPKTDAPQEDWVRYSYMRKNVAGFEKEWWYHRLGCGQWFLVERDTTTNQVRTAS